MSIKELPESLIEASKDILDESAEQYSALHERFMMLGLKRFGVKRESQLNEIDRRALNAWVQVHLAEASSCGMSYEDHMPNDEVFYNSDGEQRTDLGEEEESDESDESDETDELDEALDSTKGSEEVEAKEKEDESEKSEIKESIAIDTDGVATNGAVAVGDAEKAEPVHVDILRTSTPAENVCEFRLLLQYATHKAIQIYPPMDMPAAKTASELKTLVESMPFYNKEVQNALQLAIEMEKE